MGQYYHSQLWHICCMSLSPFWFYYPFTVQRLLLTFLHFIVLSFLLCLSCMCQLFIKDHDDDDDDGCKCSWMSECIAAISTGDDTCGVQMRRQITWLFSAISTKSCHSIPTRRWSVWWTRVARRKLFQMHSCLTSWHLITHISHTSHSTSTSTGMLSDTVL